jgi:hypothetical protein
MDTILFRNKKTKFASGFFIILLIIIGAAYWGYNLLQKSVAERFLRIADDEFYQSIMAVNRLSTKELIKYDKNLDALIERINDEKEKVSSTLKVIDKARNFQNGVKPTIHVEASHILLKYYYKVATDTVNNYADYISYRIKIISEIKTINDSVGKITNSETACRDVDINNTTRCITGVKKLVNDSLYRVKETLIPKGMDEFEASFGQYTKFITENCDKLVKLSQSGQNSEYEAIIRILRENLPEYPDTLITLDAAYFNQLHDDFLKLKESALMVQAELEKAGSNLDIFIMKLPPLEW